MADTTTRRRLVPPLLRRLAPPRAWDLRTLPRPASPPQQSPTAAATQRQHEGEQGQTLGARAKDRARRARQAERCAGVRVEIREQDQPLPRQTPPQQPQPPQPQPHASPPPTTSATAAAATALCRSRHSPLLQHTLPQCLPPPPQQESKRREHKHDPPRFPCAVRWHGIQQRWGCARSVWESRLSAVVVHSRLVASGGCQHCGVGGRLGKDHGGCDAEYISFLSLS